MHSDTLRRFVFVQLNMHLVPHSLSETEMNTLIEIDESWVPSIVVATEHYDCEMEVQQVTKQAMGFKCAGVNLMLEDVDVLDVADEADELKSQDKENALLHFWYIVSFSMQRR
jgi:hypothetical protein